MVDRFDIATVHKCGQDLRGEMVANDGGEYVRYSDYEAALRAGGEPVAYINKSGAFASPGFYRDMTPASKAKWRPLYTHPGLSVRWEQLAEMLNAGFRNARRIGGDFHVDADKLREFVTADLHHAPSDCDRHLAGALEDAATDYSGALHLIRSGRQMRRLEWRPDKWIQEARPADTLPYLEIEINDGRRAPYTPSRCDQYGDDWVDAAAIRAFSLARGAGLG